MNLTIRPATLEDVDDALQLFDAARRFMRANGNMTQWINGYPSRETVLDDIAHGTLMICEDADTGEMVAVFCMQTWPDHTYVRIFDDNWPDEMPYGTIHRLAVGKQGNGIGTFCIRWAQEHFGTLRADTHADNIPMQRALRGAGFTHCGTIYIDDGSPRMAYHWRR